MRHLEDHYGPLVTRLIRQVDRQTQQLHWYLTMLHNFLTCSPTTTNHEVVGVVVLV